MVRLCEENEIERINDMKDIGRHRRCRRWYKFIFQIQFCDE